MASRQVDSSFVGRGPEIEALRAGLTAANAGTGRLFTLVGEAGIGKTRLADEVDAMARAGGALVLWGRCWEGEGAPAFHPWRRVVRSLLEAMAADRIACDGAVAADVVQVMPELTHLLGAPCGAPVRDPEQARFRFFEGVTALVGAAGARRPLVIVFDDLHWADTPSLLLLRFVARELRAARLLLLGTYRETDLAVDAVRAGLVAEIAREGTRLDLHGLDRPEVAELIARAAGAEQPDAVVAAIHGQTNGNPFFVREIARLAAADGRLDVELATTIPGGVREMLRRRHAGLSAPCRQMLAAAAVLGREVDPDLLGSVWGAGGDVLAQAIDEARAHGVLEGATGRGGRLRFVHVLVRDVLYDELPLAERHALHRSVAGALVALAGPDPRPRLAEIAYHFREALPVAGVGPAVEWSERAGACAADAFAFEEAALHYRTVLRLLEQVGGEAAVDRRWHALVALGDAQMRAGERHHAHETLLRAVDLARALGDARRLARAVIAYCGRFEIVAEPDERMLGLLAEALAALGAEEPTLRAQLLARRATLLYFRGELATAATLSAEAVTLADTSRDPATLVSTLGARYVAIWGPDALAERLTVAERMLEIADASGNREAMLTGIVFRIMGRLEQGRMEEVDRDLQRYYRLAAEVRQPFYLWQVPSFRAMRALLDGRVGDAEAAIEESRALGERAQSANAPMRVALHLYQLRRVQGRLAEIEPVLAFAAERYATMPGFRAGLAASYVALGRVDEARLQVDRLVAGGLSAIPRDGFWMVAMTTLAEVAAALEHPTAAALLYDLLLPYADRVVVVSFAFGCDGAIARHLGLLATALGRFGEAEVHLARGVEINRRLGARLLVAHTERDLARLLLRRRAAGDLERAHGLLAQAETMYRALGLGHEVETPPVAVRPRNVLRLEGDVWTVGWDGEVLRLRDAKGLRYIAALVRDQGRELHVVDLAGAAHVREGSVEPKPDAQARLAYRQRLEELRAELEEAERFEDLGRIEALRGELDAVAAELAGAYGMPRASAQRNAGVERLRKAVSKCIRDEITRIARTHATLGRHLTNAIRTGTFCAYRPERPVDWDC